MLFLRRRTWHPFPLLSVLLGYDGYRQKGEGNGKGETWAGGSEPRGQGEGQSRGTREDGIEID